MVPGENGRSQQDALDLYRTSGTGRTESHAAKHPGDCQSVSHENFRAVSRRGLGFGWQSSTRPKIFFAFTNKTNNSRKPCDSVARKLKTLPPPLRLTRVASFMSPGRNILRNLWNKKCPDQCRAFLSLVCCVRFCSSAAERKLPQSSGLADSHPSSVQTPVGQAVVLRLQSIALPPSMRRIARCRHSRCASRKA